MKNNKKMLNRMLRSDSVLLIAFGSMAIITICFILEQVLSILDNTEVGVALLIVAIVSMLSLVGALAEVFLYLGKDREAIYEKEFYYLELIRQEKEGRQL